MKIIVDFLPLLQHEALSPAADFVILCHQCLAQENPANEWIFIGDKKFQERCALKSSTGRVVFSIKRLIPGRIGRIWWAQQALPANAAAMGADLLVNTGGMVARSSIAQCTWILGRANLDKVFAPYGRQRRTATLARSGALFVFTEKDKEKIAGNNGDIAGKTFVVRAFAEAGIPPLSWTERERVKTNFAGGMEYFLIIAGGGPEDLIGALKAFSLFKKRQQSAMQLVFYTEWLRPSLQHDFLKKLDTFAYRKDVHLYRELPGDGIKNLLASCYAMVQLTGETEPGMMMLNAFRSKVPVIVPEGSTLQEIAASAVLYADMKNPTSLANHLIALYKDEALRDRYVAAANARTHFFEREMTLRVLQEGILRALGNQR